MKAVWERTAVLLSQGFYSFDNKIVAFEPHLSQPARNTFKRTDSIWRWFCELLFGKTYFSRGYNTEVSVVDKDALEIAVELKKSGHNPALLNPANAYKPRGGYKNGSSAMEEDILKRSGLSYAIDPVFKKVGFYPLKGPSLLYSPSVPVFRMGQRDQYAYLDQPVLVSIISSAAISLNPRFRVDPAYQNNKHAYTGETERRIYAQLSVAASQNHDAVVLTAFGCGAFKNTPETVARIYKKVIKNHFNGVFKKIIFAIIKDKKVVFDRNYLSFEQIFR